jgi:hypothetical protein
MDIELNLCLGAFRLLLSQKYSKKKEF